MLPTKKETNVSQSVSRSVSIACLACQEERKRETKGPFLCFLL